MIDREKVIKGLECCKTDVPFSECYKCPYVTCLDIDGFFVECNREDMMSDAIALLKAQEPVKPMLKNGWYWCGGIGCRNSLTSVIDNDVPALKPNYCEKCGRKVKWE